MSGHSKWSTIKRQKAAADKKRGKIFARLVRQIEAAAREGDSDPEANPTLADAIQRAKDNDVPKDTIQRALKRGAGELEGQSFEPAQYEGYGPNGVAILVDCLTDNKNRTASDVRQVFTEHGGSLAEPGAVSYLFRRRGQVLLPAADTTEDDLLVAGLEAGLDDIELHDETFLAWCAPTDIKGLRRAFEDKGLAVKESRMTKVPSSTVPVSDRDAARKLLGLLDAIDDNDDVQDIYSNEDIAEDLLADLADTG